MPKKTANLPRRRKRRRNWLLSTLCPRTGRNCSFTTPVSSSSLRRRSNSTRIKLIWNNKNVLMIPTRRITTGSLISLQRTLFTS
jgi:hypothetical protein